MYSRQNAHRFPGRGVVHMLRAVVVSALVLQISTAAVQAQQDTGWSSPMLVFEGQGGVAAPVIVADDYGQVHAFWIFIPDSTTDVVGRQVYYARLDRPDWQPIDIALTPNNVQSLTGAANGQTLALLWGGQFYTSAAPSPSPSAREWTLPQQLATAYVNSSFAVAPDGALWVVYGESSTNAVFVRRLEPTTGHWAPPLFVANVYNPNSAPDAPRLTFSSDTTLHVIWAEYQLPNGWPPRGLYYVRSADGGQDWSAPHEIAGEGFNQPNILAGKGDTIYATWVGMAGVGGKYFAQSNDEGLTWSGTTSLFPSGPGGGGSEGAPNMVLDSRGRIHVLFSNSNCVWYTALEPDGWSDPDCISRSVASSHTEHPAMTIGLGNQLHVLFWANDRQLWYMTRTLNVEERTPLPTLTAVMVTATPVPPTATPTLPSTPLPDMGPPFPEGASTQVGALAMASGIVPVVVLFAIVLLVRRRR